MVLELASFGDEAPSGENLEYESVFTELEIAAQPGQERQMGSEIVAAEEPDYKEIIDKARAVLARSHDLRAAVYLAHAELRRNGLPGFAEAVHYIRGCLADYWDSCYPQLDADDDNDPTMRVNAVRGLGAPETMIAALRLAPLTKSNAFGIVNLRHQMILDGELTAHADEQTPDAAGFSAAFKDTDRDFLVSLFDAARQADEDVKAIDAIFDEKTPALGPDLTGVKKVLGRIVAKLSAETGISAEEPEEAEAGAVEGGAPAGVAAVAAPPGTISSDKDVLAALDRIMDFYSRNEPSSPVPILLARARRLVGADFLTIVNDLAPSGVDSVKQIGGMSSE